MLGIKGVVSAMNNLGQMVISMDRKVFLRQPNGTMEPRTVDDAELVVGNGLNNLGQMVGSAYNSQPIRSSAVPWEADGSSRFIPVALGFVTPTDFYNDPVAHAINDSGTILGAYQTGASSLGLFLLVDGTFLSTVGGGKYGLFSGLSNAGEVFYELPIPRVWHESPEPDGWLSLP